MHEQIQHKHRQRLISRTLSTTKWKVMLVYFCTQHVTITLINYKQSIIMNGNREISVSHPSSHRISHIFRNETFDYCLTQCVLCWFDADSVFTTWNIQILFWLRLVFLSFIWFVPFVMVHSVLWHNCSEENWIGFWKVANRSQ